MMSRFLTVFLMLCLVLTLDHITSFSTLLSLLIVDGSEDDITSAEINGTISTSSPQRELIPRIIHQTYKDEASIPAHWEAARRSCMNLHTPEEGWQYKLWTDSAGREFVASKYPWFLDTYDKYEFPIQRADALRYLVLAHYGGIYIDLDNGCQRKLDPLLVYSTWARRTAPTGISNNVMGSIPHHPFFLKVLDALPRYNRHWLLPYITVMASTGPLFLSLIWRQYNSELGSIWGARTGGIVTGYTALLGDEAGCDDGILKRIRILPATAYAGHDSSFFTVHLGNSWHEGDAKLIFWMEDHWVLLLLLGLLSACIATAAAVWQFNRHRAHIQCRRDAMRPMPTKSIRDLV